MPIALVLLVGLFLVQRRGTAAVGGLFGPVMLVWFAVLAVLGVWAHRAAAARPLALNPHLWGRRCSSTTPWRGFLHARVRCFSP